MVYKETIQNADNVMMLLDRANEISAVGGTQMGKTMIITEIVKRYSADRNNLVIYICVPPNIAVTEQTESRVKSYLGTPQEENLRSNIIVKTPTKFKNWMRLNKRNIREYSQVIVLMDETHTHFTERGTGRIVEDLKKLNKCKFVYFTATPSVQGLVGLPRVTLMAGEGYQGTKEVGSKFNHLSNYSLFDKEGNLESEIEVELDNLELGDIAVIRAGTSRYKGRPSTHDKLSEYAAKRKDLRVYYCDQENEWEGKEQLIYGSFPTNQKTLVIIKQGFSLGVTIENKKRIRLIVETAKSNYAAVIQGLLGRMTGYTELHPKLVGFCDTAVIEAGHGVWLGNLTHVSSSNVKNQTSNKKKTAKVWKNSVSTQALDKGTEFYNANLSTNKKTVELLNNVLKYKQGQRLIHSASYNLDYVQLTIDLGKIVKKGGEVLKAYNSLVHILKEQNIEIPETRVWYLRQEQVEVTKLLNPEEAIIDGTYIMGEKDDDKGDLQ